MSLSPRLLIGLGLCLVSTTAAAKQLVWFGMDYSQVKMVGSSIDFSNPDAIFPGYLEKWNDLQVAEQHKVLEKYLKQDVTVDLSIVKASNAKASPSQIVAPSMSLNTKESLLKQSDIESLVESYSIPADADGVGLVYVMDRLIKSKKEACMHITFFDLKSKGVLLSEEECAPAAGFGFRNFWFGPVKRVNKQLKNYRKAVSKALKG